MILVCTIVFKKCTIQNVTTLRLIVLTCVGNIHSNNTQKICSKICTPLCLLIAWLQAINKHSWYNGKCYATKSCPRSKSHWLPAQTKYGIEQERFSIYLDFQVARKKQSYWWRHVFILTLKALNILTWKVMKEYQTFSIKRGRV